MSMNYKKDKNGRWYVDQRINGVRCMLRAGTKKELIDKVKAWNAQNEQKMINDWEGVTLSIVAYEWFASVKDTLKFGTLRCYSPAMAYWTSELGDVKMNDIDSFAVTSALELLARRGYSKHTISNYRIVLNRIFIYWANSKWRGKSNPVPSAVLPKNAKQSVRRKPPTTNQMEVVLAHPEGFGFLASLLAYTGMRIGEANGIQVKDINLDEQCYGVIGSITINKTIMWHGNQPVAQSTKTEAGMRKVPIFSVLRPLIIERVKGLSPDDYIVSQCNKPLTQTQYNRYWSEYLSTLNMAHVRLEKTKKKLSNGQPMYRKTWVADLTAHQFRHYMATMCYEAKVPELAAQKILGHKDIATTHKIYTHIRDTMMAESVSNLDELFKREKNA